MVVLPHEDDRWVWDLAQVNLEEHRKVSPGVPVRLADRRGSTRRAVGVLVGPQEREPLVSAYSLVGSQGWLGLLIIRNRLVRQFT